MRKISSDVFNLGRSRSTKRGDRPKDRSNKDQKKETGANVALPDRVKHRRFSLGTIKRGQQRVQPSAANLMSPRPARKTVQFSINTVEHEYDSSDYTPRDSDSESETESGDSITNDKDRPKKVRNGPKIERRDTKRSAPLPGSPPPADLPSPTTSDDDTGDEDSVIANNKHEQENIPTTDTRDTVNEAEEVRNDCKFGRETVIKRDGDATDTNVDIDARSCMNSKTSLQMMQSDSYDANTSILASPPSLTPPHPGLSPLARVDDNKDSKSRPTLSDGGPATQHQPKPHMKSQTTDPTSLLKTTLIKDISGKESANSMNSMNGTESTGILKAASRSSTDITADEMPTQKGTVERTKSDLDANNGLYDDVINRLSKSSSPVAKQQPAAVEGVSSENSEPDRQLLTTPASPKISPRHGTKEVASVADDDEFKNIGDDSESKSLSSAVSLYDETHGSSTNMNALELESFGDSVRMIEQELAEAQGWAIKQDKLSPKPPMLKKKEGSILDMTEMLSIPPPAGVNSSEPKPLTFLYSDSVGSGKSTASSTHCQASVKERSGKKLNATTFGTRLSILSNHSRTSQKSNHSTRSPASMNSSTNSILSGDSGHYNLSFSPTTYSVKSLDGPTAGTDKRAGSVLSLEAFLSLHPDNTEIASVPELRNYELLPEDSEEEDGEFSIFDALSELPPPVDYIPPKRLSTVESMTSQESGAFILKRTRGSGSVFSLGSEGEESDTATLLQEMAAYDFTRLVTRYKEATPRSIPVIKIKERDLGTDTFFGRSLEEIVNNDIAAGWVHDTWQVPLFLTTALKYLANNGGLQQEGIFRKGGSIQRVRQLRSLCSKCSGDIYDALVISNREKKRFHLNDIATVVKQFLRELPVSLLTYKLFPAFVSSLKLPTDEIRIEAIRLLFVQLPFCHQHTLMNVLSHLHLINEHSDQNKMSTLNMATLMGPNLGPPLKDSMNEEKRGQIISLAEFLITHHMEIAMIPDEYIQRSYTFKASKNNGSVMSSLRKKLAFTDPLDEMFSGTNEYDSDNSNRRPSMMSMGASSISSSLALTLDLDKVSVAFLTQEPDSRAVVRVEVSAANEHFTKSILIRKDASVSALIQSALKATNEDSAGYALYTLGSSGAATGQIAPDADLYELIRNDMTIKLCVMVHIHLKHSDT